MSPADAPTALTIGFAARLALVLGLSLALLLWEGPGFAQSVEYRVKAGFVLSLIKLTRWPKAAFATPSDPLELCVLGENPFGLTLQSLEAGGGFDRPVNVRVVRLDETGICHVLFISRSERSRFASILRTTQRRPTLTIGDADGFAEYGGCVNLAIRRGKVRLEINPEAIRTAGLSVSSSVLRLATIVRGDQ